MTHAERTRAALAAYEAAEGVWVDAVVNGRPADDGHDKAGGVA